MYSKIVLQGVILIVIFSSLNLNVSSQGSNWWDSNWSSRQEIIIPFDTSVEMGKFQPIDIRVTFDELCWAKDEQINSIRVCCLDNNNWIELESQIYDLEHSDDTHIKACSLVFLIPEEANGKELYYVYYDDSEKPKLNYPDHVVLTKEHYYYEPIPGQKADLDYYKIVDEGFCVYGVGISGIMMTEYSSQMIFRQSKGQKDFSYRYWDRLGTFCFQYVDRNLPPGQDTITTRMELISDDIYTDGNLMVQFGITSKTSRGDAKTTNFYKYYYCPKDVKRICVNVKHEVLKAIQVAKEEKLDGEFAFTSGFKTRSEANTLLNTGEILPFIHYYNIYDTIKEIPADTDPRSRDEEWLVSVEDNADLGTKAWVSADSGESGKAHSLIFSSNSVIKSGTDEQDGIQIKGSQKQEADIPGLKAYSSGVGFFRNAYSSDGKMDLSIPSDLVVEFDGEFFTTELNSYKDVENEATIFQALVKNRPMLGGNVSGIKGEKVKQYNLTVIPHFAPSFPLGSLISAATGKNFSYTYAELYQNGKLVSSGICSRISLAGELNLEKITLSGIIKLFDWKNISFFKKIRFPKLTAGTYLIKIFIKTRTGNKFVGLKIIDLKEDTKTNVFCRRPGEVKIEVADQNNKFVEDAQCQILLGNISVAEISTTKDSSGIISVPRGKYNLMVLYKGFQIFEKDINIGILQKKEQVKVTLSNLKLLVEDKLGLQPGIKITPVIFSNEMMIPELIQSQENKPGVYDFINLPPAKYKIQISYKNYLDEKEIQIPTDGETTSMVFSPIFTLSTNVFDARGNALPEANVIITREGKTQQSLTDQNGVTDFTVPPGSYKLITQDEEEVIAEKTVELSRDETTYVVTTKEPIYPTIIMLISGIIILLFLVLIFMKKISISAFLKIISIALVISAFALPWWQLNGSNKSISIERTTNTYLLPQTMVTNTIYKGVQELELANIPKEFTDFLFIIIIITLVSIIPILFSILIKNRKRTSKVLTILGLLFLILSCSIFAYGFGELTKVGLGSLQGSGTLNVLAPGTNKYIDIPASWGLSLGFYLIVISIVLILSAFTLDLRYWKAKKYKL